MAWLQNDASGNFHISFRFAGRKYKRSLKTKNETETQTRLHRHEENIRLVESGRVELPEDADAPIFLLFDGKLDSERSSVVRVQLSGLFQRYFAGIGPVERIREPWRGHADLLCSRTNTSPREPGSPSTTFANRVDTARARRLRVAHAGDSTGLADCFLHVPPLLHFRESHS